MRKVKFAEIDFYKDYIYVKKNFKNYFSKFFKQSYYQFTIIYYYFFKNLITLTFYFEILYF